MAVSRGLPFSDHESRARPPLTVSELTAQLKGLIEGTFDRVTVEGELSNCRPWSSGHVYFTLKDDYAQMRGAMFRAQARLLKFKLEDGMRVVVHGRLSVYEVKGEYQIVAEAIEPHGLGALQAAFEQLKRTLQADGLFDAARKRPLPMLPRRIGIITSGDGAALHDMLRVLNGAPFVGAHRRPAGARAGRRRSRGSGARASRDRQGARTGCRDHRTRRRFGRRSAGVQ